MKKKDKSNHVCSMKPLCANCEKVFNIWLKVFTACIKPYTGVPEDYMFERNSNFVFNKYLNISEKCLKH